MMLRTLVILAAALGAQAFAGGGPTPPPTQGETPDPASEGPNQVPDDPGAIPGMGGMPADPCMSCCITGEDYSDASENAQMAKDADAANPSGKMYEHTCGSKSSDKICSGALVARCGFNGVGDGDGDDGDNGDPCDDCCNDGDFGCVGKKCAAECTDSTPPDGDICDHCCEQKNMMVPYCAGPPKKTLCPSNCTVDANGDNPDDPDPADDGIPGGDDGDVCDTCCEEGDEMGTIDAADPNGARTCSAAAGDTICPASCEDPTNGDGGDGGDGDGGDGDGGDGDDPADGGICEECCEKEDMMIDFCVGPPKRQVCPSNCTADPGEAQSNNNDSGGTESNPDSNPDECENCCMASDSTCTNLPTCQADCDHSYATPDICEHCCEKGDAEIEYCVGPPKKPTCPASCSGSVEGNQVGTACDGVDCDGEPDPDDVSTGDGGDDDGGGASDPPTPVPTKFPTASPTSCVDAADSGVMGQPCGATILSLCYDPLFTKALLQKCPRTCGTC